LGLLIDAEPPTVLILCIIFMPQGIVGTLQGIKLRRRAPVKPVPAE
jgi:hypothetical protein